MPCKKKKRHLNIGWDSDVDPGKTVLMLFCSGFEPIQQ